MIVLIGFNQIGSREIKFNQVGLAIKIRGLTYINISGETTEPKMVIYFFLLKPTYIWSKSV